LSKELLSSYELDASYARIQGHPFSLSESELAYYCNQSRLDPRLAEVVNQHYIGNGEIIRYADDAVFILYWGKARITKTALKVQTAPERYKRAIQNFQSWLKASCNRLPTKDLWKSIAARLRGHYNYYAVSHNGKQVHRFYFTCIKLVFKWMNRRSQKRSYTWTEFARKLLFSPLPNPPLGYEMIDIRSEHGTEKKHQTKSRVRKSRKHGSVRSSDRQRSLFT